MILIFSSTKLIIQIQGLILLKINLTPIFTLFDQNIPKCTDKKFNENF